MFNNTIGAANIYNLLRRRDMIIRVSRLPAAAAFTIIFIATAAASFSFAAGARRHYARARSHAAILFFSGAFD